MDGMQSLRLAEITKGKFRGSRQRRGKGKILGQPRD